MSIRELFSRKKLLTLGKWIGVILVVGIGSYLVWRVYQEKQKEEENVEEPTVEEPVIEEPEEEEIPKEVLKGFWVPHVGGDTHRPPFETVAPWAKDHGADTFLYPVLYNPRASVDEQLPWGRRGNIEETIQAAQAEGLEVWVAIAPVGGERPLLDEIDLEGLNDYIIEIAKIAESNNEEYFEPFCEPSGMFRDFWPYVPPYNEGRENEKLTEEPAVNEWAQEILSEVRKVYTGVVVYEDDSSPFLYYTQFGECPIDFSGYDYLAFGITPREVTTIEEYPEFVEDFFDATLAMAERDGIKKVMVREFGIWEWNEDEHSDEEVLEAHKIVLEKFQEKNLDGIFVLVPPEWGELAGFDETAIKDLIEEWYKEIL